MSWLNEERKPMLHHPWAPVPPLLHKQMQHIVRGATQLHYRPILERHSGVSDVDSSVAVIAAF